MECRPAPLFADAVVAFEAIEEGVGDERIAAVVERVPCGGGHIGQVFDDADVSQMNCPSIVQASAASHSAHVGARGLVGAASAASSCSLPSEARGWCGALASHWLPRRPTTPSCSGAGSASRRGGNEGDRTCDHRK